MNVTKNANSRHAPIRVIRVSASLSLKQIAGEFHLTRLLGGVARHHDQDLTPRQATATGGWGLGARDRAPPDQAGSTLTFADALLAAPQPLPHSVL
jgi:hypothetical protein